MALNDWLSNNSGALLAASAGLLGGRTGNEQAAMGLQGFGNAMAERKQQNKTLEFLRQMNPELAQAVEAGALSPLDAYKTHVQAQAPMKPLEVNGRLVDPKTYQVLADFSDKKEGPAPSFQKLDDGTYGYADPTQRSFTPLGVARDPKLEAETTGNNFKTELDTMKTYRAEDDVKSYRDVRNSYERVRSAAQLGNAQGDIGLVYGYMKMLDPGSVVREGEFATAQNSGGIDTTIVNMYNKILNGERLTPEQRQQFASAAESLYQQSAANLADTNKQYQGFAEQYGVPADRFMVQPEKYEPLKLGQSTSVTIGGKAAKITRVGD